MPRQAMQPTLGCQTRAGHVTPARRVCTCAGSESRCELDCSRAGAHRSDDHWNTSEKKVVGDPDQIEAAAFCVHDHAQDGMSFQATSLSTGTSPGRSSTRSPRMVRMMSEVPPSIVFACDRRNAFDNE